jgi:hypothetical protein
MVGGFDYTGWTVALVLCACGVPVATALYVAERRGAHRPGRMLRYRSGIGTALFITLLVALRRFVVHQ